MGGQARPATLQMTSIREHEIASEELHSLYASQVSRTPDNYEQAHHNINPDCPICLKPIFWSRHLFSVDRAWHVQCFTCSYCHKPLRPGEQSFRGGKMFCTDPCYNQLFSGQCQVYDCKKQAIQTSADGGSEHQYEEMVENRCMSCERLLGVRNQSGSFSLAKLPGYVAAKQRQQKQIQLTEASSEPNDQKQSLHPTHLGSPFLTGNTIGEQCVRCMKPVYAAEFCYSMNFPWHLHCLRCAICDRVLQPAAHAVHQGLPLCNYPCYSRLFSIQGYRRGLHECRP